jgi:hypothetical protein
MPFIDIAAWDEELKAGETSFVRDFLVNDAETSADKLVVSAMSDDTQFVPNANIKIESGEFKGQWGNVYNRRVTVTPVAGQKGNAIIALTVSDAQGLKRQQTFRFKVQ